MNDYLIAAACIIGPPLFFAGGWACRTISYRREWQEFARLRDEQRAASLFTIIKTGPPAQAELNRRARPVRRTQKDN